MDEHPHDDWRRYPFQLVPGDPQFCFPGAEAAHPDCESDTWFLASQLTGDRTGQKFAFLTIFNKNRPGHTLVADFYTFALFDLDSGTYGTYTDYDMPPASLRPGARPKLSTAVGHLDMTYLSGAGAAVWRQRRLPYTYEVALVGVDQAGAAMELALDVTPTRAPVPVGASAYNGKIACFGQDDTWSYFQTGMSMVGSLRWGAFCQAVTGTAGHVDRQWFPRYAGGGGTGGDPRARAHEWRTISLDNGVDLSIWRQFDRTAGNATQPFSGVTTSPPDARTAPRCAEDIDVAVTGYVRWPTSVRTLVPPLSAARYLPDRHRLTSAELDLDLTGEPLVPAPAHALPIEYMEGPYRYRGSMSGRPVQGFGLYERSIALYRDWELVDVLAAAVAADGCRPTQFASDVGRVRKLIVAGHRAEALRHLNEAVRPVVEGLSVPGGPPTAQLVADLAQALC